MTIRAFISQHTLVTELAPCAQTFGLSMRFIGLATATVLCTLLTGFEVEAKSTRRLTIEDYFVEIPKKYLQVELPELVPEAKTKARREMLAPGGDTCAVGERSLKHGYLELNCSGDFPAPPLAITYWRLPKTNDVIVGVDSHPVKLLRRDEAGTYTDVTKKILPRITAKRFLHEGVDPKGFRIRWHLPKQGRSLIAWIAPEWLPVDFELGDSEEEFEDGLKDMGASKSALRFRRLELQLVGDKFAIKRRLKK